MIILYLLVIDLLVMNKMILQLDHFIFKEFKRIATLAMFHGRGIDPMLRITRFVGIQGCRELRMRC